MTRSEDFRTNGFAYTYVYARKYLHGVRRAHPPTTRQDLADQRTQAARVATVQVLEAISAQIRDDMRPELESMFVTMAPRVQRALEHADIRCARKELD